MSHQATIALFQKFEIILDKLLLRAHAKISLFTTNSEYSKLCKTKLFTEFVKS